MRALVPPIRGARPGPVAAPVRGSIREQRRGGFQVASSLSPLGYFHGLVGGGRSYLQLEECQMPSEPCSPVNSRHPARTRSAADPSILGANPDLGDSIHRSPLVGQRPGTAVTGRIRNIDFTGPDE